LPFNASGCAPGRLGATEQNVFHDNARWNAKSKERDGAMPLDFIHTLIARSAEIIKSFVEF